MGRLTENKHLSLARLNFIWLASVGECNWMKKKKKKNSCSDTIPSTWEWIGGAFQQHERETFNIWNVLFITYFFCTSIFQWIMLLILKNWQKYQRTSINLRAFCLLSFRKIRFSGEKSQVSWQCFCQLVSCVFNYKDTWKC